MSIDIKDLAVSDNKLFLKSENEWISGWTSIDVKKLEPKCTFKGDKISLDVWFEILSFFAWTQEKYKSESQIRLYYNKNTKKWKAQPYPQTPSGMTTSDEQDEEIRAKFPEPWVYFGTGHHHCTAKAFQSGTDEANEKNQDGFHFTIGNLDQSVYDYHGRFSWGGELFKANLFEWIDFPEWSKEIPNCVRFWTAYNYVLHSDNATGEKSSFPEDWKDVIKPKPTPTYSYGGYNHYQTVLGGAWDDNQKFVETKEESKEKDYPPSRLEELLWDVGIGIEGFIEIYTTEEQHRTVHDEFIMENLHIALKEMGMSEDEFNKQMDAHIAEEYEVAT
jgi:hypothetical protein